MDDSHPPPPLPPGLYPNNDDSRRLPKVSPRTAGATTQQTQHRILLCDDDPARLHAVAHQLTLFNTRGVAIEVVSPRAGYAAAVLSSTAPVLVFFINVGFSDVKPACDPSFYGTENSGPTSACLSASSSFQQFQVCHISCDELVTTYTKNARR
jgi:hypothetical protein